jgi:hypothetical protein
VAKTQDSSGGSAKLGGMWKRVVLVGALALAPIWGSSKELPMAECLKLLESPKTRVRALEPLSEMVHSVQNEQQRGRCRALLLAWLNQEKNPDRRAEVARLLSSYLAYESTPTVDFEKCFAFLTDPDRDISRSMWMEFGQQASMKAMTPALRARLLGLSEDARPLIRLQAISWAHQQALLTGVHGESVPKDFQLQVLKVVQGHLQDANEQVRNEALYGCLALSALDSQGTEGLVLSHLRDENPNTRSLILDYLERHPIPRLGPELEKRLGELGADSKGHFPGPEDELNPPGRAPEEPEPYRVVRSLFRLGPLSPAAWSYLENRALRQIEPTELLAFVSETGPEADSFADQLWARFPAEALPNAVSAWVERGLSGDRLAWLQALAEKQDTNKIEGQVQKAAYLVVLGNSPVHPRSLALATAALSDKSSDVRGAAILALSKLDPQGPGGKAAMQALQELGTERYLLNTEFLLVAADRLGIPNWLSKEPLLHPDLTATPHWLDSFGRSSMMGRGVRLDLLKLQLRWLEAHPAEAAKVMEGLRELTRSPDSRVVSLANATLARLQAKP